MAYYDITISAYLFIFFYFVCEDYLLLPGLIFAIGMVTLLDKFDLLHSLRSSSLHSLYQSLTSLIITHIALSLCWWPFEGFLKTIVAAVGDLLNFDGEDPKVLFPVTIMAACIFLAWATDVTFLGSSAANSSSNPTPPASTTNPNHHKTPSTAPMPAPNPNIPRNCKSEGVPSCRSRSRRRC